MAYRKVSEEEFKKWARRNPGMTARIDGQEIQTPVPQAQDLGFLGNLARGVTKPLRTVAAMPEYLVQALQASSGGQTEMRPGQFKSIFLTPEEEIKWARDPVKEGLKSSVGLGAYLVPGGGGAAKTTAGRIGTAAGRGTISGTMSGLGYSDDGDELKDMLTGGLFGGAFGAATQGIGEASRAIKARPQGSGKVVNTLEVDEIAALPKKVKQGLAEQTKSAGFWNEGIGETKSIQNFLKNRGLAGKTPQETLEKMTQEFYRAQQLKKTGIKEIGGLSRGYIDQIKGNIDEAIQFSGLSAKEKSALKEMFKVLDNAPTDAKTLDKIAQDWYKMGLTRAGEQKMTQSGLFMDGARSIRDALKTANQGGSYTEGMSILSQILGLEDQGQIAKAAQEAARQGIDLPLFAGAGFRGADVKVPQVSNVINKTRANIGIARETGQGMGGGALSGLLGAAAPVANVTQRATPGIVGAAQSLPGRQEQPQLEGLGGMLPPQEQGPQIDQMALIQAVLNGDISTSEADWLMEMLGPQASETSNLETAISELERLYGAGTPQSLSLGDKSTGVIGLANKGIAAGKGAFNQEFADRKAAYDQARALAVGIINQAREAGVLNEGEYQTMIENMPNEYTTERVAQDWFQNVRRMLANSGKSEETNNAAITNIMPWIAQ